MFVGAVSDNFDERIDQKIFHAEIVVDSAKVSAEMKAYQPIPIIADFTNEDGSDSLKETIEANYKRVKQEVLSLVESETERIKVDPALAHLVKEWRKRYNLNKKLKAPRKSHFVCIKPQNHPPMFRQKRRKESRKPASIEAGFSLWIIFFKVL